GYAPREIIGTSFDRLTQIEDEDEFRRIATRIKAGEPVEQLEAVRRRKDGTLVDVWVTVSPIFDRHGEVAAISSIERDVSLRKRAEQEIREAMKHREQFLAILSHELRNPMAAVASAARVLRDDAIREDMRRRAVSVLQRQTSHMSRMLDDLLDISRIRQG